MAGNSSNNQERRPLPLGPTMSNDSSNDNDDVDVEAERMAQRARDESVAMISDHLYTHLDRNPNSSFVTWIATLHPENAHVTLDTRFTDNPNNPWRIVYDEVTNDIGSNNGRQQRQQQRPPIPSAPKPSSDQESVTNVIPDDNSPVSPNHHPIPSAPSMMKYADSAVIVEAEALPTATVVGIASPQQPPTSSDLSTSPQQGMTTEQQLQQQTQQQQQKTQTTYPSGSLIDIIIGGTLVIFSASFTLIIELISIYCYLSCYVCYKLSQACSEPHVRCCTALPFVICWLLYKIFQFMELLLFALSIIIVELIAFVGFIFCTIFSLSCYIGQTSHQRIRKVAHVTRWAFRQPFQKWKPQRGGGIIDLCLGGNERPEEETNEEQKTESNSNSNQNNPLSLQNTTTSGTIGAFEQQQQQQQQQHYHDAHPAQQHEHIVHQTTENNPFPQATIVHLP